MIPALRLFTPGVLGTTIVQAQEAGGRHYARRSLIEKAAGEEAIK